MARAEPAVHGGGGVVGHGHFPARWRSSLARMRHCCMSCNGRSTRRLRHHPDDATTADGAARDRGRAARAGLRGSPEVNFVPFEDKTFTTHETGS